ncbi:MAG: Competence protein A [Planctomycetes bacterium ADurb.Bin401]|nr:MAG: Competence protein A [Planctomycetes bacterium ADurb.Bin401]
MKWFAQQKLKLKNTAADCRRICKSHSNQLFGLDIGTCAIKLVQLKRDENGYALAAVNTTFVDNSNDINSAVKKCIAFAKINSRLAISGVCGQETAVRHFTFPALLPEEIEGAVRFEAKQVCPFNSDDGVIDYQVISSGEKEVKGFLAVATNNIIKHKNSIIKQSSLENVLMDFDGLALINCLRYCDHEPGKTSAIINVGNSYTTVAIISDDNLPFIRDISYAGKHITDHLAQANDVSPQTIEQFLHGQKDKDSDKIAISDNLEKSCQRLISNITETLYYDAVRRKSELVNKIYLCGGFALVEGFADLMKNKLPAPTALWNPFEKIQCDTALPYSDLLRKNGPAFAVAAGLAMRQI